MDWNYILLLLTAFGCVSLIWRSMRPGRPVIYGWGMVGLFILGVTAGAWMRRRDLAGFIGFGVWALLGLLPPLFLHQARRLLLIRRFDSAYRMACAAALLHPLDGWADQARLMHAQALAQRGRNEQALQILGQLVRKSKSCGFMAQCHQMEIEGRWGELAAWIGIAVDDQLLSQNPELGPLYLTALGESGDPGALLVNCHHYLPVLLAAGAEAAARDCRLIALAWGGRPRGVERILEYLPSPMSRRQRQLWLATAELAAGDPAARTVLAELADTASPNIAQTARRRLEHPPAPASGLTPEATAILEWLEQDVLTDRTGKLAGRRFKPWTTWSLILLNVAVFCAEIAAGGSTNDRTLERLGGLYPELLARHQYWRLLTANFLHYGWQHILFNMLALLILGPFVEESLGVVGFLIVYFFAGVGAMAGVLVLQHLRLIQTDALVGASGAIMGLVGAAGAVLLRLWRRHRAMDVRQRLLRIVWIVILQVIFDALTPMVSSSAHLVGLGCGFFMGLILSIG
jgi:rhomboid protease GluP